MTAIITQARMTSSRLPGKILKEVLGKPLLEYQIERLTRVNNADTVIVATTTNDDDEPVVALCKKLGVTCFRGSEEDVLSRYYYAALQAKAETVIRVTSDCPLIDPVIIDQIISYYNTNKHNFDYVSNTLVRSFPRGMDTEVFSFTALETAFSEAVNTPDREHVTPYLYRNPDRFRIGQITSNEDESRYRLTVDTVEDFNLIKLILEELYQHTPHFSLEDVLRLLRSHPDWCQINANIRQKQYGE